MPPPLCDLSFDERQRRLCAAVLQLAPEQQAVVVLQQFGGLSPTQVAVVLDLPVDTVKARLIAARRRLGELLLAWSDA